jgi:hypothetical protein
MINHVEISGINLSVKSFLTQDFYDINIKTQVSYDINIKILSQIKNKDSN